MLEGRKTMPEVTDQKTEPESLDITGWEMVPTVDLVSIWECTDDTCTEKGVCGVHPDFYVDAGTPVCWSCANDMTYKHTLIRKR